MKYLTLPLLIVISMIFTPSSTYAQAAGWVDETVTVEVDESQAWTDTGLDVTAGKLLIILSQGTYSAWGSSYNHWYHWLDSEGVIPDGGSGPEGPLPGYPGGCLIARIDDGEPFYIGQFMIIELQASGRLYLGFNDPGPSDNRGLVMSFIWLFATATDVYDASAPGFIHLSQNFPNPFNPQTRIEFTLNKESKAILKIYSSDGRLVRTLLNERLPSGRNAVDWDGKDDKGHGVSSGTYFYRLAADGVQLTEKAVLIR